MDKWIQCKKIIGFRYDTFGYIKIDHKKAVDSFKKEGIEWELVDMGKSIRAWKRTLYRNKQ